MRSTYNLSQSPQSMWLGDNVSIAACSHMMSGTSRQLQLILQQIQDPNVLLKKWLKAHNAIVSTSPLIHIIFHSILKQMCFSVYICCPGLSPLPPPKVLASSQQKLMKSPVCKRHPRAAQSHGLEHIALQIVLDQDSVLPHCLS